VLGCSISKVDETLQQFWGLEHIGITPPKNNDLTHEEEQAVDLMEKQTFYKEDEKTWYTSLLFKEEPTNLDNNFVRARAVLYQEEKRALKNDRVAVVNSAYNDMIEGGFAEKVPQEDTSLPDGKVHYLQTHPVYKLDRDSTKCRIVMNAAAKGRNGCSLNDLLFQGPCLLPDFVQVLIRFRINFVAFVLDISKMFLRIKLHQDADFLRFMWRDCDITISPEIWRMISVTFGIVSSPFQAIFVVLKHAKLFKDLYELAQKSIQMNMYMDDVPDGEETKPEAEKLVIQIYELLLKASMTPHKFASNEPEILRNIPTELINPKTTIKVLGIQWDTKEDKLLFNFVEKFEESVQDTKRSFLQQSAKIFDPIGLIAPLTTTIKILFQQVWLHKIKWDENLPENIQSEWTKWKHEFEDIKDFKKSRCFFNKQKGMPKSVELFAFGDASNKAYAAAVYVKGTYKDGTSSSELVFSKTRVTPIKMVEDGLKMESIVRLELLAALITARALEYVLKGLSPKLQVTRCHCFTDSMINLHRIKNGPEKYKVWVGHRISEILSLTTKEQWRHCPGTLNPADLPSRGLTAKELMNAKLWWEGPDFIHQDENSWPTQDVQKVDKDWEEKKIFPVLTTSEKTTDLFFKIFNRFSSWNRTVDLFSYILRFGCKEHQHFSKKKLSVDEKARTEMFLFRKSQQTGFPKEFTALQQSKSLDLNGSKIKDYNPKWDCVKNLIISESRLTQSDLPDETKCPIILPKNCQIVEKFIAHQHETHGHSGTEYTLSILRQQFRLVQGRRQVQKIVHKCMKRKCARPTPLQQQMAPLPSLRTDGGQAFKHVSVDLFGPMFARHWCKFETCPHPPENKVYCALFTCFHSRAVHLELIREQSTGEFLAAFRAFVGRRGTPSVMFSDNAKNFKSGSKEIRSLYRSVNWSTVREDGRLKNIDWIFNVEKAPWANGIAERMVRSVKTPIRIIVGSAKLTFRQLSVILTEVEAIVNNRPLAIVSDHPDDLTPITPAELIIGRRMDQLPDPNPRKNETSIGHLWRKRQHTLNAFWKRWRNDYLLCQDIRKKWHKPTDDHLLNKVVLIRDDNISRNDWKLGRIQETFKSKDGLIRTVLVKTQTSLLRRPIQRLALLENVF